MGIVQGANQGGITSELESEGISGMQLSRGDCPVNVLNMKHGFSRASDIRRKEIYVTRYISYMQNINTLFTGNRA